MMLAGTELRPRRHSSSQAMPTLKRVSLGIPENNEGQC